MVKLIIYDENDNKIKEIDISKKDLFNERLQRSKSLLKLLLENDYEILYGCMGGSCGACIYEIVSGMEYLNKEGLHKVVLNGMKKNNILTCITIIKKDVSDDSLIELKKIL